MCGLPELVGAVLFAQTRRKGVTIEKLVGVALIVGSLFIWLSLSSRWPDRVPGGLTAFPACLAASCWGEQDVDADPALRVPGRFEGFKEFMIRNVSAPRSGSCCCTASRPVSLCSAADRLVRRGVAD
jgi:hypothetical protein